MALRFDESWLEKTNRDSNGKFKKGKGKKDDGFPKLKQPRNPIGKAFDLMAELAPSVHAKALAQLAKNPDLVKGKYEHFDQVRYCDYFERKHPDIYELLHATPNGGARSEKVGFDMKAEGQKKGYPDVTLDAARGIYHGLRLELKYGTGRPSPEQLIWQERLRGQGYCSEIVNGWEEMVSVTLQYWLLAPGESLTLN